MSRRRSSPKNTPAISKGMQKTGALRPPASPSLHHEDAALWAEVTKSLTPLKEDHDRLHFGPLLDEKPDLDQNWQRSGAGFTAPTPVFSGKAEQKAQIAPRPDERKPAVPRPTIADLGGFTRRQMRQINSGAQPIEARLDLHGLRQAGAHVALRGFLVNAQRQDLRHVLVITGKGRSNTRDDQLFGASHDGFEQGVLRRVVPLWLAEPDLRSIVAGFSEAPPRHGGEGALYVRLRRNRSS